MKTTDHYTLISADTHAGGNHEQYRSYLDSKYVDEHLGNLAKDEDLSRYIL